MHLHLRDGEMLEAVAEHTAAHFGRGIIMPNLIPPVVTATQAKEYRQRIMAALPPDTEFEPLMT
ncbi:MAG: dihydroorotase, partial [Rhizobiaceae bacterium]